MIAIGGGKNMGSVQRRIRTHIEVIRLRGIEHVVDRLGIRTSNRSGWQTGVLVRVIRRIDRQVAIQHALEFEIAYGVLYRRTSLQQHAFVNAVDIEAGDKRHLAFVMTLALDDGRYDSYLDRRQTDRVGFRAARVVPENVILALHALEELLHRDVPIHLVGVRNEEAPAGLFVQPVGREERIVLEGR